MPSFRPAVASCPPCVASLGVIARPCGGVSAGGSGRLSWAGLSRALPGRCRTTDWSGYTSGRRRRGSVLVWLDREREGAAPKRGRPGRSRAVSEAAIRFGLRIEVLVGLALRPTLGMVASRLGRAGLDGPVPDRPALSRRQKTVSLPVPARRTEGRSPPAARQPRRRGRGEGDWPGRRHGSSRRRARVHLPPARRQPGVAGPARARSQRTRPSAPSRRLALVTPAGATPPWSGKAHQRSFRSARTAPPGARPAPPPRPGPRPRARPGASAEPSGRG